VYWVWTALGITVTLIVLTDIAQTLFAPAESGSLSAQFAALVWKSVRRISRSHPNRLSVAGSLIMVLTIGLWTVGLTVGGALIYWPRLTEDFLVASGLNLAENESFADAVYVSMVTLGTLGYGDLTPQTTFLRFAMPLQALIGFALFTAAISWIMSVYPALSRQRHLAREVQLLHANEREAGNAVDVLDPVAYGDILKDFANQVVAIRNDLVHHSVTYYFRVNDPDSALTVALPSLHDRARLASAHDSPDVRFQALLLSKALDDLAGYIASSWLPTDHQADTEAVLRAYAEQHLHRLTT
jgi:hypothetical protein